MEIIEIFMLRKSSIIEPFILFVLVENIMTTCTQVIGGIVYNETFYFILNLHTPFCF